MRLVTIHLAAFLLAFPTQAADPPIFDAHLHCSHDAWDMPPSTT